MQYVLEALHVVAHMNCYPFRCNTSHLHWEEKGKWFKDTTLIVLAFLLTYSYMLSPLQGEKEQKHNKFEVC
jgi:hypothetical protein